MPSRLAEHQHRITLINVGTGRPEPDPAPVPVLATGDLAPGNTCFNRQAIDKTEPA